MIKVYGRKPERWELTYDVIKRRAGHAPEGSGVPVGTGYHWFILSHQYVKKLNANDYTTSMVGIKFKLAINVQQKINGVSLMHHKEKT